MSHADDEDDGQLTHVCKGLVESYVDVTMHAHMWVMQGPFNI